MQTYTYGNSISNFMRWAEEKIAKAVEDDEKLEAEAGTRDFIQGTKFQKKKKQRCQKFLPDEEKIAIVNRVYEARRNGKKCWVACDENGVHQTTVVKWRKDFNLPKYKK